MTNDPSYPRYRKDVLNVATNETDIATLKVSVLALEQAVRDQWKSISELAESRQDVKLILYRIDEFGKKLDTHDKGEFARAAEYEARISTLEKVYHEFHGGFRTLVSGIAVAGSLLGAAIAVLFERWFGSGGAH